MNDSAIDLFSGCGGLSLGAHLAGLQTAIAIDIDKNLSSSFCRNFPSASLLNSDLLQTDPSSIRKQFGIRRPMAVIGGPPCQGFSVMGRRQVGDPRNMLLGRFFEYVRYFKPSFFLMENVPGLAAASTASVLEAALDILPGRYKVIGPVVLDAADFGAATSRPRLVVAGYDPEYVDSLSVEDFEAVEVAEPTCVMDAIWDLPKGAASLVDGEWGKYRRLKEISAYAKRARKAPSVGLGDRSLKSLFDQGLVSGCQRTLHTPDVVTRFQALSQGERDEISKYPKLDWTRPAHVLRAGTGADKGSYQAARPIHPDEPRVITVREAARIQGFPDWFQFHPTKWHSHRMIGNSVSPIFAEAVLRVLMARAADPVPAMAAD